MNVLLIVGEICAGKDTMVSQIKSFDTLHIDLGTLVREKFNTQERVFDNTLEDYFIARIKQAVQNHSNSGKLVITGIRQVSLHKKISKLFEKVDTLYLVVPRNILKERYEKRGASKDSKITFEDAIKGDESLGMLQLQNYLLTEVECNFKKNY